MRVHKLGPAQIEASVIGFGGWALGGWMWAGTELAESIKAVHAALDYGINLIDTAPMYGFGLSERLVGEAIHDRRDDVVLATKCGLVCNNPRGKFRGNSTSVGFDSEGHISIYGLLSPGSIRTELNASLRRLKTDYIDLYQTHWPDQITPIEDTMATLLDLKQEGKIRAIGASNVTSTEMEQYRKLGPLDADQELYSMLDRKIEVDQLPYCREKGIALLAYSPLAQGLLTGKATPERTFAFGDQRRDDPRFSVENRRRVGAMLDQMRPVAEELNITLAQLATAWALHQPGLTHALCGIRNVQQAEENAAAGNVELTDAQLRGLHSALAEHAEAIV